MPSFKRVLDRILNEMAGEIFEALLLQAQAAYRRTSNQEDPSGHSYFFPAAVLADYLDSRGEHKYADEIRKLCEQEEQSAADHLSFIRSQSFSPEKRDLIYKRKKQNIKDKTEGKPPTYSDADLFMDFSEEELTRYRGSDDFIKAMQLTLARIKSAFDGNLTPTRRSPLVKMGRRIPAVLPNDLVSWSSESSANTQSLIRYNNQMRQTEGEEPIPLDVNLEGNVISTDWAYSGAATYGEFISPDKMDEVNFRIKITEPAELAGQEVTVNLFELKDPPYVDALLIDDIYQAWAYMERTPGSREVVLRPI